MAGQLVSCLPLYPFLTFALTSWALQFPEKVTAYLQKEISLGRIAGPVDAVPFTNGFVVLPLNTIPKRSSDECRVVVDLSWPCGASVSDGIPSDSYLGEPISLTYPTTDSFVDAVISLGPGCLLYKHNLKKAYH